MKNARWAAVGMVLAVGSLVATSAPNANAATSAASYQAPNINIGLTVTAPGHFNGQPFDGSYTPATVDLLQFAPPGSKLIAPAGVDTADALARLPIWVASANPAASDMMRFSDEDHSGVVGVGVRPDLLTFDSTDLTGTACSSYALKAGNNLGGEGWCDSWIATDAAPSDHRLRFPYAVQESDGHVSSAWLTVDVDVVPVSAGVQNPQAVTLDHGKTASISLTPPSADATFARTWCDAQCFTSVSGWTPATSASTVTAPPTHLTMRNDGPVVTFGRDDLASGTTPLTLFAQWATPGGDLWTSTAVNVTATLYQAPVALAPPVLTPTKKKAKPVVSCVGVTPVIKTKKHGANAAVVKLGTKSGRVVPVSVGQLATACGQPVWVSVSWYARGGGWHRIHAAGCGGVGHKRWLCAHTIQVGGHTPTRPKVKLFRGNVPNKVVKHHGKIQAIVTIKRAGTRKAAAVLATPWFKLNGHHR